MTFTLHNLPPQKRINWGELNGQTVKFARSFPNERGMCASVLTVAKLKNAGQEGKKIR